MIFGYAYGKKPNYKLDPSKIVNLVMFVLNSKDPQSFRIESIAAAGPAGEKPPIDPNSIRVTPTNGFLLGGDAKIDAEKQISSKGAQVSLENETLKAVFPVSKSSQSLTLKPTVGRWNLRDYLEVRVKVRNDGPNPIMPRVRLESNGGPSDWAKTALTLDAGQEAELVIPFAGNAPINLAQKIKNPASPATQFPA